MPLSYISKQLPLLLRQTAPPINEYVPRHPPVIATDLHPLKKFFQTSDKILVVTGAGISTESGIPDYRSEAVGLYARSNHKPVQYHDFLNSSKVRQRYWARNYLGWPKFSRVRPNITHFLLQLLEKTGKVSCIVTQNVDSLHSKAGSFNVIELHGTAFRVVCLNCRQTYDRHHIQDILTKLNPDLEISSEMIRPDGDVDVFEDRIRDFQPPFCESCNGILKPDITFFGDNIPRSRVENVKEEVSLSDSLLVLGSSLTVFSGYRIALQAAEEKKQIAIVNIGGTRADKLADFKVSAKCSDVLVEIFKCGV